MEIDQLDVKTAYLNVKSIPRSICHSLKGLKILNDPMRFVASNEASMASNNQAAAGTVRLIVLLESCGYVRSAADPRVYIKRTDDNVVLLALYVDDIIIASNSRQLLNEEKK